MIRKISMVILAAALGIIIAAFEPHRHFLAAVWPVITDYFDYLFS